MNDALMTKWLWNIENSNGLWQKSLRKSIVKENPLFLLDKNRMIPIFGKKLGLRETFYSHCRMIVGYGRKTSFWKNTSTDDSPLSNKFPCLFDLAYDKDISVNKVLSSNFEALSFRRRIMGNLNLMYGS